MELIQISTLDGKICVVDHIAKTARKCKNIKSANGVKQSLISKYQQLGLMPKPEKKMKRIKYVTLVIEQSGARAAGSIQNYELTLDPNYSKVTGIEFIETDNANARDYDLRVDSESDNVIDFLPRQHYLAIANNTTLLMNGSFKDRFHDVFFDAKGLKSYIGVKNNDALLGGETLKIKVVFRLEN